jgi:hypothetical protein
MQVIADDWVSPTRWPFALIRFAYPFTRLLVHCPLLKARFATGEIPNLFKVTNLASESIVFFGYVTA